MTTTTNSRWLAASPSAVYRAFTTADALATWMAPGDMRAVVHDFDLRVGGGYSMSLFYPSADAGDGKSAAGEDRYEARFVTLVPDEKVVLAIRFDADDAAFQGEMTMDVTLESERTGTRVTIVFRDIPAGISPADNSAGTEASLDKLAAYLAAHTTA